VVVSIAPLRSVCRISTDSDLEVTPLSNWQQYAQIVLNMTSALSLSSISENDDVISAVANVPQVLTRAGDQSSRLQSQDQVRKGDASGTPLQYIYEASDCKIFYTAETYADPDAAWKQAWDAFQDDSKCVEGSTGHASSISGGFKAFGAGELKAEDQPKGSGGKGGGNGDDESAASTAGVSGLVIALGSVVSFMML
jgi:hypothetical protein